MSRGTEDEFSFSGAVPSYCECSPLLSAPAYHSATSHEVLCPCHLVKSIDRSHWFSKHESHDFQNAFRDEAVSGDGAQQQTGLTL